jgi:SAM-dependent methyltransferase
MMEARTPYDVEWFSRQMEGSLRSAQVVVPIVVDLVKPKCVVDVGCGVGTWLAVFKECGVENIKGLDGDYVDRSLLRIPREDFHPVDLTQPFSLEQTFDLAVSLEVAEHLPQSSAIGFVESLVKLAPIILFSAAVPYQGGTDHLNEQWPEYWKQLFLKYNYKMFDPVRKLIFNDKRVEWWYRQNIFMFASSNIIEGNEILRDLVEKNDYCDLTIIHSSVLARALSLRAILRILPVLLINRIMTRLRVKCPRN